VILPSSYAGRSSEGQDEFVIEALGAQPGFFVDSGASDGITGSNTYRLEREYGWRGICVEPNAQLFADLRGNRRADCVNCCLHDRRGEVDFVESAGVYGGIFDEYDPLHLRYVTERFGVHLEFDPDGALSRVRKPARSIGEILREHRAPRVVDYWSLDTEGSELAVLRGFPFGEYALRAITIEHNNSPERGRIREFLGHRGYTLVRDLGIDDCYLLDAPGAGRGWRSAAWSRPGGPRR
jgi:FkbM family methyltransferase